MRPVCRESERLQLLGVGFLGDQFVGAEPGQVVQQRFQGVVVGVGVERLAYFPGAFGLATES